MHTPVSAIQEEQKRQAESLLLADRQGAITREEIDSDLFDRPPNIEIIKTKSLTFVSKTAIENAITFFLGELGFE